MSPIPLGILAASGGAASAFELISTQVLSTTAATVTFSSIPATYKHLQVRATMRNNHASSNATNLIVRLNSDSGSNYSYHELRGSGSSVSSSGSGSVDGAYMLTTIPAASTSANFFSPMVMDVLDYSSTSKNTTLRTLVGGWTNNLTIQLDSNAWFNTAAVTTLALTSQNGSFISGCRFSLYGVRG